MTAALYESPVAWKWGCTLSDLEVVESLDPEVRDAVERYIRSRLGPARSNGLSDEYVHGWEDGVEAMRDEVTSVYVPAPRRPSRSSDK